MSRTANMDAFLAGGDVYPTLSDLTDSGKRANALSLPVDVGTRVVFAGGVGSVLPAEVDGLNPGARGVVIRARTANGASTSDARGCVFVRWDNGTLSKVPHTLLRAERGPLRYASSFSDKLAMLSAFQVLSMGGSGAYGVSRKDAIALLKRHGIHLPEDARPPDDLDLNAYLEWSASKSKTSSSTVTKSVEALIQYLERLRLGETVLITDIARHPSFRGLHFAHIMKAVAQLAKLGKIDTDGSVMTRKAGLSDTRIKVASIGSLNDFLKVGNSTLVQKATRDLWSLTQSDEGYVIERLFDASGDPLKA